MRAGAKVIVGCAAAALLTAAGPGASPVSSERWGALQIGMSETAAAKVVAMEKPDPKFIEAYGQGDYRACHRAKLKDQPGVSLMFQDGRLTRFELFPPSRVRTQSGVAVGASEAQVLKANSGKPEITTAEYVDEPAHSILYWTVPGKRGVRFLTNERGRVVAIYAGDPSIQLIEGCL